MLWRWGPDLSLMHHYTIIDEVDSILIDEARTPLIISGPMQDDNPLPFKSVKPVVQNLVRQQQGLCNEVIANVKSGLEQLEKWWA